jgi:tetratricopeptide (TPR) repeat protein
MNHALKLQPEAKRDPKKRQLLALVGLALMMMRIPGEAEPTLSPSSPAAELRAAKLMELNLSARNATTEEWNKLDKVYSEMDKKYPKNTAVKSDWAQYLWERGEKRRAMEKWKVVTEIDPKNASALSSLGNGYLEMGKIKQAAACFTQASESAPSNASYHFDLANVVFLFRHDLLDAAAPDDNSIMRRAISQFAEASRLEPLNVEYAKAYAYAFYALQPPDWATALTAWEHFLEITPQKDFAYSNLARVHMKLGQKTEALACLAQIRGADFDALKARLTERIDAE